MIGGFLYSFRYIARFDNQLTIFCKFLPIHAQQDRMRYFQCYYCKLWLLNEAQIYIFQLNLLKKQATLKTMDFGHQVHAWDV